MSFLSVNEHPAERVARVVLGVLLIALAVTGRIGWWGYIGAIPVLTGLVGTCPIYMVLGFSTCPAPPRKA